MAQAISEALAQEMERDKSVFIMGEDVEIGGVWGTMSGLRERFGPERVMDTPISEAAFLGAALGSALAGMRPVVDLMYADFFGVCMDQIYNHMAKLHYRSDGRLTAPIVVMAAFGAGLFEGCQHSQAVYGSFAHLPGMKIVVPSNAYDAKGLMIAALRDNNPVIFFHHKCLLGAEWAPIVERARTHVPIEMYTVPIGKAKVTRPGKDLTIVSLAALVNVALDAADDLADDGIEAEVIDVRSLVPLDMKTILESVSKTRRLLVVDEDYLSFGVSGEIVARVCESGAALDAPPIRVATPDVPIAFAPSLQAVQTPSRAAISMAARRVRRET